MSFWRYAFSQAQASSIDLLLDQYQQSPQTENVQSVVIKVMQEEDLLQEAKTQNGKLIDFLSNKKVLELMLKWLIEPPIVDEKVDYKLPFIACEVLCCENPYVVDEICNGENIAELLDPLWDILERPSPLNPVHAGYFSRIMGMLTMRRTDQMVSYVRGRKGAIQKILNHLDCYSLVDLLLKFVISQDYASIESTSQPDVCEWLQTEQLIQSLVEKLSDVEEADTVAMVLTDLIQVVSQSFNPDPALLNTHPLIKELKSKRTIEHILDSIFKNEGTLVHGCVVLMELLKRGMPPKESPEPSMPVLEGEMANANNNLPPPPPVQQRDFMDVSDVVALLTQRTKDFNLALQGHSSKPSVLGMERFTIVQLLSNLLRLSIETALPHSLTQDTLLGGNGPTQEILYDSSLGVFQAFIDNDVLPNCIVLFFTYQSHNILHNLVADMILMVLRLPQSLGRDLARSIIIKGSLLAKICAAQKLTNQSEALSQSLRLGYMAHVTLITSYVVEYAQNYGTPSDMEDLFYKEVILPITQPAPDSFWAEYVNGWFKQAHTRDKRPLAGGKPVFIPTGSGTYTEVKGVEAPAINYFDMNGDQMARFMIQQVIGDLPMDRLGIAQAAAAANSEQFSSNKGWIDFKSVRTSNSGYVGESILENERDGDDSDDDTESKEIWPDQDTPLASAISPRDVEVAPPHVQLLFGNMSLGDHELGTVSSDSGVAISGQDSSMGNTPIFPTQEAQSSLSFFQQLEESSQDVVRAAPNDYNNPPTE